MKVLRLFLTDILSFLPKEVDLRLLSLTDRRRLSIYMNSILLPIVAILSFVYYYVIDLTIITLYLYK